MTEITLNFGKRSYGIYVGRNLISSAGELIDLKRKVLVLTDTGVPSEYAQKIAAQAKSAKIVTVAEGESSKSYKTLEEVHTAMLDFGMTRSDALVAVGGGVIGDLGGFAAAAYMRGIDFYNIPTTTLAQVDSSVGGKSAINLAGVKNVIGAFYQPRAVIADIDTLKTLDARRISAGLAESVKMALTLDEKLFSIFENEEISLENIEKIITRSIEIKKSVVESDERESGERKILNFGHTLGHGIEAGANLHGLYHGECIALGMLPMCNEQVRERLIPVLKKLNLNTELKYDIDRALSFVANDKKCRGGYIEAVFVNKIGECKIEKMTLADFEYMIKARVNSL